MGRAARDAASAFVTWHTLVAVLAVAPDWPALVALRPLVRPCAALLVSEGRRNFFAPNPDPGRHVRYEIEDAAGRRHAFTLSEALSRDDPAFLRLAMAVSHLAFVRPRWLARAAQAGR